VVKFVKNVVTAALVEGKDAPPGGVTEAILNQHVVSVVHYVLCVVLCIYCCMCIMAYIFVYVLLYILYVLHMLIFFVFISTYILTFFFYTIMCIKPR
jgi:hypothetical protein